jgi:hypothetical protein
MKAYNTNSQPKGESMNAGLNIKSSVRQKGCLSEKSVPGACWSSCSHAMTMIAACQTDPRPRVQCIGLHDMPNIALPSIFTIPTTLSASQFVLK